MAIWIGSGNWILQLQKPNLLFHFTQKYQFQMLSMMVKIIRRIALCVGSERGTNAVVVEFFVMTVSTFATWRRSAVKGQCSEHLCNNTIYL